MEELTKGEIQELHSEFEWLFRMNNLKKNGLKYEDTSTQDAWTGFYFGARAFKNLDTESVKIANAENED